MNLSENAFLFFLVLPRVDTPYMSSSLTCGIWQGLLLRVDTRKTYIELIS